MLEVNRINSFYGRIQALRDVSLRVEEDQIISLLGANGAGKTTTLKTIVGLNRTADNDIRFRGVPLGRVPPTRSSGTASRSCRSGARSFRASRSRLTWRWAPTRGPPGPRSEGDIDWIYEFFPALAELRHMPGGKLSGGQQQMLAIGRALMSRPKLLLLDEPTLGISPLLVQEIFAMLVRLNEQGVTILLVEQNAHLAFKISSYAYILENGRVLLEGPTNDLRNDDTVRKAYLGAI